MTKFRALSSLGHIDGIIWHSEDNSPQGMHKEQSNDKFGLSDGIIKHCDGITDNGSS